LDLLGAGATCSKPVQSLWRAIWQNSVKLEMYIFLDLLYKEMHKTLLFAIERMKITKMFINREMDNLSVYRKCRKIQQLK